MTLLDCTEFQNQRNVTMASDHSGVQALSEKSSLQQPPERVR